jgi:hypothetical protein
MTAPAIERSPWPPNDFMREIEVTSADDWWSLQTRFTRRNVWDIIVYNFNTRDADEVNWYLHNKIGCTLVTPDHKNFRFGFGNPAHPSREIPAPAGKKLKIFIPHPKWTPPTATDERLRQEVVRTLRSAEGISIDVGTISISGFEFRDVADKIESGEINIRHNPHLGAFAAYTPKARLGLPPNQLDCSFAFPTTDSERALIVHEAVHAALDVRGEITSTAKDEGLAYVAQSLWVLQRHGAVAGPLDTGPKGTALEDKILEMAWNVAISLDGGSDADEADVDDLHTAVDFVYGAGTRTYDGV